MDLLRFTKSKSFENFWACNKKLDQGSYIFALNPCPKKSMTENINNHASLDDL
jgi:hypothetical protein